ncbi:MAG: dephospho-CoA kinase [Chloroflexota bacterium]
MSRAPGDGGPPRIGLTGPIGCGKSTVAERLRRRGARVIDADRLARDVTAPDQPTLAAIVDRFGPDILANDGSLDRAALGRRVFDDPAELRALEAITHPAIRPLVVAALDAAAEAEAPAVVLEAIRLVEGGYADLLDEVWLVVCDPGIQRLRLARRGLAPAEADQRIERQAGLVERARPLATRIIDTSGSRAEMKAQVDAAFAAALAGTSGPIPERE